MANQLVERLSGKYPNWTELQIQAKIQTSESYIACQLIPDSNTESIPISLNELTSQDLILRQEGLWSVLSITSNIEANCDFLKELALAWVLGVFKHPNTQFDILVNANRLSLIYPGGNWLPFALKENHGLAGLDRLFSSTYLEYLNPETIMKIWSGLDLEITVFNPDTYVRAMHNEPSKDTPDRQE